MFFQTDQKAKLLLRRNWANRQYSEPSRQKWLDRLVPLDTLVQNTNTEILGRQATEIASTEQTSEKK